MRGIPTGVSFCYTFMGSGLFQGRTALVLSIGAKLKTKRIAALLVLLGLIGLSIFGWLRRDLWEESIWPWAVNWPLTEAQVAQIQDCESLDWMTLVRLIAQDVEDSCPLVWLPTQSVDMTSSRRENWLVKQTESASLQASVRAHLILENMGRPAPGLPVVLDRVYSETDAELIEWLGDGDELPSWIQPVMRHRLEVQRWSNGFDNARLGWVQAMKWLELEHSLTANSDYRERLFQMAAEELGLDVERFDPRQDIRERGGAYPSTKPPESCNEPLQASCLSWLADQVQRQAVGEWQGDEVTNSSQARTFGYLSSMIALRYQKHPGTMALVLDVLETYRDWFNSLQPAERRAVMTYWLVERSAPFGPTGKKMLSDLEPVQRLLLGASSPWIAILLWEIFEPEGEADVEVVMKSGTHFVRLGPALFEVGPCELKPIEDQTKFIDAVPVPMTFIAAQASLEWASYLVANGFEIEGRQLVHLSAQFDATLGNLARRRLEASKWVVQTPELTHVIEKIVQPRTGMRGAEQIQPFPSPSDFKTCTTSLFTMDSGA